MGMVFLRVVRYSTGDTSLTMEGYMGMAQMVDYIKYFYSRLNGSILPGLA